MDFTELCYIFATSNQKNKYPKRKNSCFIDNCVFKERDSRETIPFFCPAPKTQYLLFCIFLLNFAVVIICNTTYHVECSISGEFLDWLRDNYLPSALEGGFVGEPRLLRLMGHREGGACFALQLQASTLSDLQRWNQDVGKRLHEELVKRFGNKVAGFTTFMEVLDL